MPDTFEPLTAIAIGYLGSAGVLDEKGQAQERAPRTRLALNEVLFQGAWGRAINW